MASQVTLKALGLNYSPNNLALPEGSLLVADDVIIRRDNVVESRRGINSYSELLGSTLLRPKQLIEYKNRILVHYGTNLAYDTEVLNGDDRNIFNNFSGSYSETQDGLRIKSLTANKNLYFTTSEGIKKISAKTADDFTTSSGFITDAGVVKALDFKAILQQQQGQVVGFLPVDSTVAYRVLWGYKDRNENTLLGTPSDRVVVYNYLSAAIPNDLNTLLNTLDSAKRTVTISSVSVANPTVITTSEPHGLSSGDIVYITGTNTSGSINGQRTITVTGTDTFTVPVNVTSVVDGTGTAVANFVDYGSYYSSYNVTPADPNDPPPTAEQMKDAVLDLASRIDTDLLLADATGTNCPLITGNVEIATNVCKILFSSGDATTVFAVGDAIRIAGANATFTAINNDDITNLYWSILDVQPTYITFSVTAANAGPASAGASITINSYNYRKIASTGDSVYTDPLDTLVISAVPTSEELRTIQNTILRISDRLKSELTGVIATSLIEEYFQPYNVTDNGNVLLNITIPDGIDSNYFYQVYRTRNFTAVGGQSLGSAGVVPVEPDDEMRLVFESFPTTAEMSQGYLTLLDEYPEDLALVNQNLYTNPTTGEGILQANDIPPFAKDINSFKNVTFYSNTKTRQRLNPFQLLGISNIDDSTTDHKLTIGNSNGSITYSFVTGVQEESTITFENAATAAQIKTAIQDKYFIIYSGQDERIYYVWFRYDNSGTDPNPTSPNTDTDIPFNGIRVDLITGDNAATCATKLSNTLNTISQDFNASVASNVVTVTNVLEGITSSITTSNGGDANAIGTTTRFTVAVATPGDGEDASIQQVLLSSLTSRSQAIDETARSLARVINQQNDSAVYAYYISSEGSPPGQINLESKILTSPEFYVMASGSGTGSSFNPDISPEFEISGSPVITAGSGNVYNLAAPSHGLVNGDEIMICGSNCTPSIDGVFSITKIDANNFSVTGSAPLTVNGTFYSYDNLSDVAVSDNEEKQNRIYYSKKSQPEAVPLLNYFDVGSSDKAILRIFPLRDSLFVFKEDGLYRVSGESAPFVQALFDSSCILIAPDSVDVSNNIVYAWTSKGISNITEAGVTEISRPIDTEILKLASSQYTNFSSLTWGIGYDSDNSYTVFTNAATDDEYASIGFRYSNLTNTWTNVQRIQTCGIINRTNDKMYLGSGESNIIEIERKEFSRKDYADEDFYLTLNDFSIKEGGSRLTFPDVSDISVGDVITQSQVLTVYGFNNLLLKLDADPSVGLNVLQSTSGASTTITVTTSANHELTTGDYVTISNSNSNPVIDGNYQVTVTGATTFTITVEDPLSSQASSGYVKRNYELTLSASNGANMRDKLEELASYLDTDPGLVFNNYFDRIDNKSGSISSNSIANPTIVTTVSPHELVIDRIVTISGTQSPSSIPEITGILQIGDVGTFGSSSTFSIEIDVTTGGGTGLSFNTAATANTTDDLVACFNDITNRLNNDAGASYSNYPTISNENLIEAVVINVNRGQNYVDLNLSLPFIVGDVTVYKAIPCSFIYAPLTFGDPLSIKQIYEATMMFNNKAFTKATAAFNSDLKPEFHEVEFEGQGNGIFGHYSNPGFGYGFFGGSSNAAPFRTIIPRDAQRCRFLTVKYEHQIAREQWALFGITLTGNVGISTRGYR